MWNLISNFVPHFFILWTKGTVTPSFPLVHYLVSYLQCIICWCTSSPSREPN